MITEGEAAILLETTRRALGNLSQSKQRSTLVWGQDLLLRERSSGTVLVSSYMLNSYIGAEFLELYKKVANFQ